MDKLQAFWRKIKFIIIKEFLATIKDPLTRTVLFAPIIVESILFGYAATFNLNTVPYAVLDESHSSYSTELISKLDGTGIFQRARTLTSSAQIADSIDSSDAMLVITIPQDFSDKLAAGLSVSIKISLKPSPDSVLDKISQSASLRSKSKSKP